MKTIITIAALILISSVCYAEMVFPDWAFKDRQEKSVITIGDLTVAVVCIEGYLRIFTKDKGEIKVSTMRKYPLGSGLGDELSTCEDTISESERIRIEGIFSSDENAKDKQ
jgi:hypothetical protein